MLRALIVVLLMGTALANDQQQQIEQAQNGQEASAQDMETEQRTNVQKPQTLLILKPSKNIPQPIHCGQNEVISECVTPCQPTCEFPNQQPCPEFSSRSNMPQKPLTFIVIKPVPNKPHHNPCSRGCVCKHGYVRSEFGVCIHKSLCPPLCKPHSHFEKCGPRCQPTCELAEPRSLSVCSQERSVCVSGCFCDAGYVKDLKTGQCVKPKDCTQICPENEHYSDYGIPCAPTCQNPHVDYKCDNYSVESPGCYCNRGYLRDWNTRTCVLESECSHKKCAANEHYYENKPCTPTCAEPQRKCSQYPKGDHYAPAPHYSGCDCKHGLVRDTNSGKCVKLCECPQFQTYKH